MVHLKGYTTVIIIPFKAWIRGMESYFSGYEGNQGPNIRGSLYEIKVEKQVIVWMTVYPTGKVSTEQGNPKCF